MRERLWGFSTYGRGGLRAVLLAGLLAAGPAYADEPIKIGFGFSQTGPLAPNGKQVLLGARIRQEEATARGGLLGRAVDQVVYDAPLNASNVHGIYAKLLDVDKVDLIIGPERTNLVAVVLPVIIAQ